MRWALLTWAACSALGAAVVALPDSGPRLFSFSRAHGPSAVDAVGAAVMLAGWAVFVGALWRRRGFVRRAATGPLVLAGFALGLGAGLVVASAGADYAYWWAIGAGILVAAQVLLACLARAPKWPRPST